MSGDSAQSPTLSAVIEAATDFTSFCRKLTLAVIAPTESLFVFEIAYADLERGSYRVSLCSLSSLYFGSRCSFDLSLFLSPHSSFFS